MSVNRGTGNENTARIHSGTAFSYPGKEAETGERGGTGKPNVEVAHTHKDKNHTLSPVQILVWRVYGMPVNDRQVWAKPKRPSEDGKRC